MKLSSARYLFNLAEQTQKLQQISILRNRLFLIFVVAPTLLSVIYFGLIASNIYISESRFIVRAQGKDNSNNLAASISGTMGDSAIGSLASSLGGLSSSQNDALTAENYITSRDALKQLNQSYDLTKAYSSSDVDRFNRFGGIVFWDKSQEAFFQYYLKNIVSVTHDDQSGITTLSVNAFTPVLSYEINQKLNDLSENLINRLNVRARQDMLQFAQKEVDLARQKVEETNQKIYQFRNNELKFSDKSPTSANSPNNQVTLYQQLASEKNFADRNLAAALATMEQARIEAMKKILYIERIAEPNQPDMAMEPKRIRGIITVFVLGLFFWGIASMVITGVKEHHNQ
ncbi:hypothetical protein [Polynucleobacter sphagniphilus]|uniref:hypothetical protein n=1 Tax=Polynucleobacter sphagniphilus TaxID=1743169 RepID=UPI00247515D2|nr:hypothetical protein [Polynucleobacter sphagniphilus]MDH6299951.1 capsular polysaccharide transport system permease protein [Polynucleobacter sphagniphilus]